MQSTVQSLSDLTLYAEKMGVRLDDADRFVLPTLSPMEEMSSIHHHIMDKGEEGYCYRGGAPPTLPGPHRWPPSIPTHIYTDGSKTDECVGASMVV